MATNIYVNTPPGYPIIIGDDLRKSLAELLPLHKPHTFVTDQNLHKLYYNELQNLYPKASWCVVPPGESSKNLSSLNDLYSHFIKEKIDRTSLVIALGGGVITDLVGFAAATYMRGVPCVYLPTSLLAMVDASIGGKVGIDLPGGKNLAGAFQNPYQVLIDPMFLDTLPEKEWRCGVAEVMKHGLLSDESLLDPEIYDSKHKNIIIEKAIRVKVGFIESDPLEKNIRAFLNLGHTFAHAIEQVSHYRYLHGEAVAIGLRGALYLSKNLKLCSPSLVERLEILLQKTSLVRYAPDIAFSDLYQAMQVDKKWQQGNSRFILLKSIGQPTIQRNIPINVIEDSWKECHEI